MNERARLRKSFNFHLRDFRALDSGAYFVQTVSPLLAKYRGVYETEIDVGSTALIVLIRAILHAAPTTSSRQAARTQTSCR